MELDEMLRTFVAECRELLESMEELLLGLEQAPANEQNANLNAIFRAAHTIKGSAGLFGLDDIVAFTHGVENLLDKLRAGTLQIDIEMSALLLACGDHISVLVDNIEQGNQCQSDDLRQHGEALSVRLQKYGAHTKSQTLVSISNTTDPNPVQVERLPGRYAISDNWHISLRFHLNAFRDGFDPISFLRYLSRLGQIVDIHTISDAIPAFAAMEPESCYLGYEINLHSNADKNAIADVFDFIKEDSHVRIIAPRSLLEEYVRLLDALPEEDLKLGEILVKIGALTDREMREALVMQQQMCDQQMNMPLGSIVVTSSMVSQDVLDAALSKQAQVREHKTDNQSLRIDAEKLDTLINLIGELVIAGAGTALCAKSSRNSSFIESVATVTNLMEAVRDSALRLRMVQIGATFNRFKRIVRDVSQELGKDIALEISGAETELDKTVVEKIGDPLMHLVRNAMDHGIEPADKRTAAGKPATGTLRLHAYHDSGSIVIEVVDDGAGLNKDKILQKAVSKGLINEGQKLEEQEIYQLIFEAGFSTAEAVTNLSGRGVGLDVVKRNIQALRGSIEIISQPGLGCTFRIRMPLTLAIIDGFLVTVEKCAYVVPLDMVKECVELAPEFTHADGNYINLRGDVLPFIRLRELFAVSGTKPRRENVVVVQSGGYRAGLVVDRLHGEFQTVIKPLSNIFSQVRGIGGSTILGNGEVALIIDVPGLVKHVTNNQSKAAIVA